MKIRNAIDGHAQRSRACPPSSTQSPASETRKETESSQVKYAYAPKKYKEPRPRSAARRSSSSQLDPIDGPAQPEHVERKDRHEITVGISRIARPGPFQSQKESANMPRAELATKSAARIRPGLIRIME